MIRILHHVAIMNRGGQETFIMNVYRAIDRTKIQFDFLCELSQDGDYDDEIRSLGGNVFCLNNGNSYFKIELIEKCIRMAAFFKKHAKEYAVFHIHTQHAMDGYIKGQIAKAFGISKVIVHSHSTNTLYHPRFHFLFRPLLAHTKLNKFACSVPAGEWLFGRNEKYTLICNGINTNAFAFSPEIRERIRKSNQWTGKHIIGHVGSFSHPKNHEFLIDVFGEIALIDPEAILVLVGAGEKFEAIKDKVARKHLENRVVFLGLRKDIHELVQAFDLFLFPSLYEGFPVVLVEAQCAGLPCLISDSIPSEVRLSQNVIAMSFSDSTMSWAQKAEELLAIQCNRSDAKELIVNAGYDIQNTASLLQDYYSR